MSKETKNWTIQEAVDYYGIDRWGGDHFSVDRKGAMRVHPSEGRESIAIFDVVQEAVSKGLKPPMVIRFQDLLRHRVVKLNEAFARAIREENYAGAYRGVFPIKVNQLREVVEEILDAGETYNFGIEAGSKPELLIALALHQDKESLVICNGYKDEEYIRLAMLGRRLGKKIFIVIEQVSEVEPILEISREMGIEPLIGVRAKLLTRGEGKWAMSTGDKSKFGLTTEQILGVCRRIREAGLENSLQLLHFHIGSQVPNILTIKNAVVEAARFYCELVQLGFPMGHLDVGGGLGIDYDGSRSNYESSVNYTLEQYARDVVFNIREVCQNCEVAEPDITSESGRAIVAPHSMLVLEVFDRISKSTSPFEPSPEKSKHRIIQEMREILANPRHYSRLERFHDALQKKDEAFSLFNHGYLDLESRAAAESLFWQICRRIDEETDSDGYVPEELLDLKKLLVDQYVCNFSVFQSLLDHWAFNQLFPVAPIHRLRERPTVNSILVDITCDSDGKISRFIDLEDVKDYIALHPLDGQPYYIGVFLTGAYQDIMGDLHNLFGRVNEVHVFLEEDEEDGFYIEESIRGSHVKEVIDFIQYKESDLMRAMKKQIDRATRNDLVRPREGTRLLDFYQRLIEGKTYLNIDPESQFLRQFLPGKTPPKRVPPKAKKAKTKKAKKEKVKKLKKGRPRKGKQ